MGDHAPHPSWFDPIYDIREEGYHPCLNSALEVWGDVAWSNIRLPRIAGCWCIDMAMRFIENVKTYQMPDTGTDGVLSYLPLMDSSGCCMC